MKISKERFDELGLGYDCDMCEACIYSEDCKFYHNMIKDPNSKHQFVIAPCLDESRLKDEMTEEEYDAYCHNRLTVMEDTQDEMSEFCGELHDSMLGKRNREESITREELAELCDARDKICNFCENEEHCPKCQVKILIDDAYACCQDIDE